MFLALLACQLALAAANPFHKYPYVFLLDVGNEELEKTNTEQIRVSIPGGSLALRYPALGNGDTIAHVRVSGVDFGTDLKANIVDGGPGYKYVTLVFMGNPGVPYDAVMTIETVSDSDIDTLNQNNEAGVNSSGSVGDADTPNDSAEVTDVDQNDGSDETSDSGNGDDRNDSSEDLSDAQSSSVRKNAEITQESSNVYKYAKDTDEDEDDDDDTSDENDKSVQNYQNNDKVDDGDVSHEESQDEETVEINKSEYNSPNVFNNDVSSYSQDSRNDNEGPIRDDANFYETYQAIRPNFYDGVRIYPQNAVPFVISQNSRYNPDSNEVDQTFNDEDDHNNPEKFTDTNNNYYIDSDDNSAVAS